MQRSFSSEFVYQVFSLILSVLVVHSVYVLLVRPQAAAVLAEQQLRIEEDPAYVPERSIFVVLRDLEQESCFILMLWALAIMGYKGVAVHRQRELLERDLIPLAEGTRILPDDTREYARHVQALPEAERGDLLPRSLLAGLRHFAATRNVHDVASTTTALAEAEGERLDAELSMIRYIAWAIPSIGFIGTVRGIGQALGLAHRAMDGDITGVTQSLGVAFNSTFVALVLSLFLMFFMHQLQLMQERLVLDTQSYVDDHLIRHMSVRT